MTNQGSSARAGLKTGLGNRHTTMIALGGVIGAGLFVGSGTAISKGGPGVLVAYLGVGAIVVLVMRMLAEMAVAQPETGSFSSYATRELGPWAGLAVGWLYAYQWCVTIGFEAIAGAAICHQMLPMVPSWLAAFSFLVVLIGVNLVRVSSYGEFEFWFALIKVVAIIAFIGLGLAALFGLVPSISSPGLTNLVGHGGFFPQGGGAVVLAALAVFFSFFGTEVVTVTAGEAVDPIRTIRRGMNSVVWRILIFYVGSIFVVVALLPWNSAQVTQSPYTAVLQHIGIPNAALVMNLVVLTAVLSCLNSGLYASSRMLYAMARRGEAPSLFTRVSRSGTPIWAVFAASSIGLSTVIANYFLPTTTVFEFLLESSGSVAVIVYLCITATQLVGRRRLKRENPSALTVPMWGYPYLSILVGIALLAVIGGMGFDPDSRDSMLLTLLVTGLAVIAGLLRQRRIRTQGSSEALSPPSVTTYAEESA